MSAITLSLEDELTSLLNQTNQPIERAVRELIVLELYRRGMVSSGKAGQLLGMSRWDFIQHASRLGIPYIDMTEDEWEEERLQIDRL